MSGSRAAFLALVGAAVASTFATGALAQPAPAAAYSDGVDPMQATPTQREQAQARFARGKELFEQGNFEAALVEFDASRAIVASPNTRLYRARCLRALGQLVLAYTELGRTMVEALELVKLEARYARTVEAATQERKALQAELGFLNVTVHHPRAETRLFVNGEEIRRSAWSEPLPSAPGAVQVEVSTPGLPDTVKDASVAAGASVDIAFDLGPDTAALPSASASLAPNAPRSGEMVKAGERPPASLRPYAFIAGGVGVLGLGAFGVFGAMSRADYRELEDECVNDRCPTSLEDTIDRGRSRQQLANIGLAVGVVGVGAAVTLWLLEPESPTGVALDASWNAVQVRGSW